MVKQEHLFLDYISGNSFLRNGYWPILCSLLSLNTKCSTLAQQ